MPLARLLIVVLMLGTFAVAFAELVRQADALSGRPQAGIPKCGDAAGMPCPSQRQL